MDEVTAVIGFWAFAADADYTVEEGGRTLLYVGRLADVVRDLAWLDFAEGE